MTDLEVLRENVPLAARSIFEQYAVKLDNDYSKLFFVSQALQENFDIAMIDKMASLSTAVEMQYYLWKYKMSRVGEVHEDICIIKFDSNLYGWALGEACNHDEALEVFRKTEPEQEMFQYSVHKDCCTITKHNTERNTVALPKELVIPEYIGYYKVEAIADDAFLHCGGIKSVALPAGIQRVGHHAFADCKALNEVFLNGASGVCEDAFPEGVTIHE